MNLEDYHKMMELLRRQITQMPPLLIPGKRACQICGKGHDNERCWYTGDWLCERCGKEYAEARERFLLDLYVLDVVECSKAMDWNIDRLWAIVPYNGS